MSCWALYFMAASLGHLGQIDAAREALARARILDPSKDPRNDSPMGLGKVGQQLFHDGIALAEAAD